MPEQKTCQRCKKKFTCRADSIHECQCSQVDLTSQLSTLIRQEYNDCLCFDCLVELQTSYIT